MLRFNNGILIKPTPQENFNTSYVAVQRKRKLKSGQANQYFNTSYVAVQQANEMYLDNFNKNFNTSYVAVQQDLSFKYRECNGISIHLMLRFNNHNRFGHPN